MGTNNQIKEKNYFLSAGQYFEVKIEYSDISPAEFDAKMQSFKENLDSLFLESKLHLTRAGLEPAPTSDS
jgi:type I restriction enzyme M protein